MRCGNSGKTRARQVVRGVGPLTAAVVVMLAYADTAFADTAFADTLPAAGQSNSHEQLITAVNDRSPLHDQWWSQSVDGLRSTDLARDEAREVEEIRVVANPRDTARLELEKMRQERMREEMYAELRLREEIEKEMAWWQADPDLEDPESLVKWGYSPQADYQMRRDDNSIRALSADRVQTGSVLRIAF